MSLRETYSVLNSATSSYQLPSYNSPGSSSRHISEHLTPGLQPSILKHNVRYHNILLQHHHLVFIFRDFTSELKKSLSCVLDGKTSSSLNLERCIDVIGSGMIKRLDLTEEYINILNKIELLNQHLNYV